MSGILNVPGLWPVFDANGDPVSGATILFYEPGTTTPKAVYSDDTLATSLGTQLTTNAGGEPTTLAGAIARLWWAASGSVYDVQVIAGASTRTWSGVGIESGGGGGSGDVPLIESVVALRTTAWPEGRPDVIQLEYNHAAGDGGGFFRWDSASVLNDNNGGTRVKEDATSIGRWIRQVNDGWVHASWFGLVLSSDEATAPDNTTAMQRALNSAFNVRLPSGSFWCGLVTQSTAGQIVEGDWRTNWRHPVVASGNLITINDTAVGAIWRGFKIDGNRAALTYFYNACEILCFASDVIIENNEFKDCQSFGVKVIGPANRVKILNNHFENLGDFGIFTEASSGEPIDGLIEGNTVYNFGISGNGGATTSVGIGVRSATGGWRVIGNSITNTTSRTNDQLGIEFWTNSNNGVISSNVIDFSATNSGEFGISATGYGMVVGDNLIRGTDTYGIELIDRAATCTGNMIRSPRGAGISVSLNAGHSDPGDVITISGNSIEDANSTSSSFAGIVVDGVAGVNPIGITIAGNTIHGKAQGIRIADTISSYTLSGNTIYNTGGALTCINAIGTDGCVTGNNIFRVSAAGDGNIPQAIQVVGSGTYVGGNRIAGNSRITNGIVVALGAANVLVGSNHYTGIITNSVVSASTSGTVIVQGGVGNVGVSLQTANRCMDFVNASNESILAQNIAPTVGVYTVAGLPTSGIGAAQIAYASNGRKNGEGVGAGTGVLVFRDGSAWRACDTGATVAA